MRLVPPSGPRIGPDPAAVSRGLAPATSARVLAPDGALRKTVSGAALRQIVDLLEPRASVPPFDHWYIRPAMLSFHDDSNEIARAEVVKDGSVCFSPWGGFVELCRPRELFEVLAQNGLPELLPAWNTEHDPAGEEARLRFRQAVPAPIAAVYNPSWEALAPVQNGLADLATTLISSLGPARAIEAILAWYGCGTGPIAQRPEYESLPKVLLAAFAYDTIVATFPSLVALFARAGAARFVLDASPMPPILAKHVLALPEEVRHALLAAARETMGDEDALRLSAEIFPTPASPAQGLTVLGHSATARLVYPVTDGHSVYARDGKEIVRFSEGARTSLMPVLGPAVPLAFHDGALIVRFGDQVTQLSPKGDVLRESFGASDAERQTAASALSQTGKARLTGLPLPATAAEAYVEYAHLGLPLPKSADLSLDVTLGSDAKALVNGREVPLPGPARLCDVADRATVVVLTRSSPSKSAVVWLTERGAEVAEIDVDPEAVKELVAAPERAFVVVSDGRGYVIAAVSRPVAQSRWG